MKSETALNAARRVRIATAATLILGLFMAGAAQAQWTVSDPVHTAKTIAGWIETHKQDLKEIQKWKDDVEHYKQQLADAQKVLDAQSMPMTMDFSERPLNYGMASECPDKSKSGGVESASDRLTSNAISFAPAAIDKKGEIKKQQLELCQKIVYMQNSKYNEMITMLKNIQQRDSELKKLDIYRNAVGTSQGKLATSSNQFSAFLARAQMDMQYSQTAIATYEGYIASLKNDQAVLAAQAMQGDGSSLFNALLQGAVLKASFAAIRASRTR